MRKFAFYFLVSLAMQWISMLFLGANAQTGSIQGEVRDPAGYPAQHASVQLLKIVDTSVVYASFTDSLGLYFFRGVKTDSYFIQASYSGLKPVFTKVFQIRSVDSQKIPEILYFKNSDVSLEYVTVTGKKPMIEQKADRMVINVKNSITDAGGTALDVLEKSPGVSVNRQNNGISVNGKNGVSVMINGKITYMPMDAVIQFLAGLPAGNIDKIELITTPPSKYDAAGNGGYINIVLLNNPYSGLNGSYFLTAGFNNEALGAAGINMNYRTALINVYGSYSFRHDHYIQPFTNYTRFTRNGDTIINSSFSNRDAVQEVQNAKLGVDFQMDSATVLGAMLSGYNSRWTMIAHNGATISKNGVPDTAIISVDDPEMNLWQNMMANINFQHKFRGGRVLNLDANYIYYKDNNPNTYSTDYFNHNGDFISHEDLQGGKITPINFWVFSGDYTTSIGKNLILESGAKIALSNFKNQISISRLSQGMWIADTSVSAGYLLKENTGALYTSLSIHVNKKISIRAGLRYEYTISDLSAEKSGNISNRKYGELFPTFYFTNKIDQNNTINFTYSRRITRPAFNDLAPFTIFFDPKTFYSGNPTLQPAIANTVQLGYGFRKFFFTISFTHESNAIDNFYFQTQKIDTTSGIVYLSARNYQYEQYLTAGFSLPVVINNWWSMQNNLVFNWREVSTSYEKTKLLFQYFDFSMNTTQRFSLPKDFSIELTGIYSSSSYVGTAKRESLYQLDAGLQKKFKTNEDVLRFSASDIFNSGNFYKFGEIIPGTGAEIRRTFNFGVIAYRLTYTHNFGNKALKGKRDRESSADDELRRVHY